MRYLCIVFIFLLPLGETFPQATYSDFDHFFGLQINSGVTFFDLSPMKEGFKSYVNGISKVYNIPLEVQRLFPTNISWSGYLFWYFSPRVSFIIGPEYASTRAFSRYEDYSGTLDIKSELREIYLIAGIRFHFPEVKMLKPLIGLNIGLTQYNYEDITDLNIREIKLNEINHSRETYDGYIFEISAGFNYDIKIAVMEFLISYRNVNLNNVVIKPDNYTIRLGIEKGIFK